MQRQEDGNGREEDGGLCPARYAYPRDKKTEGKKERKKEGVGIDMRYARCEMVGLGSCEIRDRWYMTHF